MAKKRENEGAGDNSDKKRRAKKPTGSKKIVRPKDDYIKVKPIKRTPDEEEEAEVFALLAHHWDIIEDKERAAQCAFDHGAAVCEGFNGKLPKKTGFHEMYRRSAIRGAKEAMVLNDVEYELWRYETQDPRVIWFRRGFISARGKLEHSR